VLNDGGGRIDHRTTDTDRHQHVPCHNPITVHTRFVPPESLVVEQAKSGAAMVIRTDCAQPSEVVELGKSIRGHRPRERQESGIQSVARSYVERRSRNLAVYDGSARVRRELRYSGIKGCEKIGQPIELPRSRHLTSFFSRVSRSKNELSANGFSHNTFFTPPAADWRAAAPRCGDANLRGQHKRQFRSIRNRPRQPVERCASTKDGYP